MDNAEKFIEELTASGFRNSIEKASESGVSKPKVKVTTSDGKEHVFTNDFLLLYMGENQGLVIGTSSPEQLVHAVDMILKTINGVMSKIPDCNQVHLTLSLLAVLEAHFATILEE